jgi:hypothetical protein
MTLKTDAKVAQRIEEWKLKLIDLSRRNKLINYRSTKSSGLQITSPSINSIFDRLINKGRAWEIWTPVDPSKTRRSTQIVTSQTDPKQIDRILRNLTRRSTAEYRERGVRILYITFGMLNWRDASSNQNIKSPIILVPIELTRKTLRDPVKIQVPAVEEEIILNPALRLKLFYDHQIELPPLPDFETSKVSEYLQLLEDILGVIECDLDKCVDIGLFSFQKLVMYQDLNDNKELIVQHPIIRALSGIKYRPKGELVFSKEEELDHIDPKMTFQVLDADSSQQLCIQQALNGHSFVMHGPPGTGKSQTISNMISEFIARGKSVLFVSEKMAALEVVYNRLKAKNLDEYCLELHSQKANKREVVQELNRCLTEHQRQGATLTDEELDRLLKRRAQLSNYVDSLHMTRKNINLSAYQVLNSLSTLEEVPFVPSGYPNFKLLDHEKLLELEDGFRRLSNTWTVVEEGENFPWLGCTEKNFTPQTRSNWIHLLDNILKTLDTMTHASQAYSLFMGLPPPHTILDYENLQTLSNIIAVTPKPPKTWFEEVNLEELQTQAEMHRKEWENYRAQKQFLRKRYDSRFLVSPKGLANSIELALDNLCEWLQIESEDKTDLYIKRAQLKKYLDALPQIIHESHSEAVNITEILRTKKDVNSIEWMEKLSILSSLCQEDVRPPRAWLEKKAVQNVEQELKDIKDKLTQKELLETKLMKYNEEFLQLDHGSLIEYFEGPRKSIFSFFSPKYHRINRLISKLSADNKVAESIIEDLKIASELNKLNIEILSSLDKSRKIFDVFFNQDLDIEGAEKALVTANRVIRIIGKSRVPKALRDNLCYDTEPSNDLIKSGDQLKALLSGFNKESNNLKKILPKVLPNSGKSLRKSSLQEVLDWVKESSERLSRLETVGASVYVTVIDESKLTYQELIKDLKVVETLQEFEDNLREQSTQLSEVYGDLYNGLLTDWVNIKNAIGWTIRLIRTLPKGVPDKLKQAVSGSIDLPIDPKINERWDQITSEINELRKRFDRPLWSTPRETLNLDELRSNIQLYRTRIDDLRHWVDFKDLVKKLGEEKLGNLINKLITEKIDRQNVVPVFQKTMNQGILETFYDEDQTLKMFRGKDHEQLINDFRRLDQRLIDYTPHRVIENVNNLKPQGIFVQSPDSEITILMREAAKKRKHMPLRDLFERIPNLIRLLKPCLMMSPISVSQFLIPGSIHFDLVVFDEASQIYTEDAIGSIYRGNQFVVAGDPKQLPPTPFFQYILSDEFDWDEEYYGFDLFDSVLDECMSIGLPVQMLKWHYRSKHESLIGFSNDNYYDGRLIIFPASQTTSGELGVEYVYVKNGVYNRGSTRDNPVEAEVVADLVFNLFEKNPDKTVGVVTFSIAQMNKIQDIIDQKLKSRPDFEEFFVEDRLNGFFVKNLENVQGDERDVMIFSVGYGYDEEGRITMNFGPLNKPGGERRLNVAITRAKEKVFLVSSIRYDDIILENTKAVGVHSLHDYLRYAEKRPKKLESEKEVEWIDSGLEREVALEVEKMGYKAVPRVGLGLFRVDLGVLDPNDPDHFILGIMFDGDNYRMAKATRDRDRLREQILTNQGWRIHKIWSPDWVQQRNSEVKRLKTALEKTMSSSNIYAPNQVIKTNTRIVSKNKVQEKPSNKLPHIETYDLAEIKPRRFLKLSRIKNRNRYLKQYRSEVRRLIPQLVEVEAPVHYEFAYKRINKVLRIRSTSAQKEAYWDEIKRIGEKKIRIKGDFLWKRDSSDVSIRAPDAEKPETHRLIQYIPIEEAYEAMLLVAKHSMGISEKSLIYETAYLLGFKRLGSKILKILTEVYQTAVESGKLVKDDNFVKYAHSHQFAKDHQ